jgi:hypothetical protein
MNFELIGHLVRLRYKLLWARTRTRNGKIAVFFAGYLLLVMAIALLASGGAGTGMAAVRSGKGFLVASLVLGVIYLQALIACVLLGFGMNAIFSEFELRRYPIKSPERRIARHAIGILDPFWFLFLAMDLGLAFGLYLFGAGSLLLGTFAVLILFLSNYVCARVLGQLVDRLMMKKGGSIILLGSIMCMGLLPSVLGPLIPKNSPVVRSLIHALRFTPPAGAAAAMTRSGGQALTGLAVVTVWLLIVAAALVYLERHPAKVRAAQSAKVEWDSPFEKVGRLFGPVNGPLMAHWLRFFSRNNRFRTVYPLTLPLTAFLIFFFAKQAGPAGQFPTVLGAFAIVGCLGTAQFAVNQFGYVDGGFRRFLLLPTGPAAAFRAGSYTFLALSSVFIPIAAVAVSLFHPFTFDGRVLVMLVGASVFSLFFFHGVALWVSVLAPRRGNFAASMGNDLSFAANIVVMGWMLSLLFLPRVIAKSWPDAITPANWWVLPPLALAGLIFYVFSLRSTAALFAARREQILAVIEIRG